MSLLDELRKHSCIDIDCNDDAGRRAFDDSVAGKMRMLNIL